MERPLDHIAIALPSISAALPVFERLAGVRGSPIEHVPDQHVNVAFIGTGPNRIELIEPASPDSPIASFLERRGAGLHHIAYRVPDLVAALDDLAALDWELIDRVPRTGAHGRRVAFVHPRSTHRVLVELVEGESITDS